MHFAAGGLSCGSRSRALALELGGIQFAFILVNLWMPWRDETGVWRGRVTLDWRETTVGCALTLRHIVHVLLVRFCVCTCVCVYVRAAPDVAMLRLSHHIRCRACCGFVTKSVCHISVHRCSCRLLPCLFLVGSCGFVQRQANSCSDSRWFLRPRLVHALPVLIRES